MLLLSESYHSIRLLINLGNRLMGNPTVMSLIASRYLIEKSKMEYLDNDNFGDDY